MIVPAVRRHSRLLAGILLLAIAGIALAAYRADHEPGPKPKVGGEIATPDAMSGPTPEDRMVVTYFYYWYDLPGGPHSEPLTDHPADPEASYLDVSWFRQELLDMKQAGIDAGLASYWGIFEPSSTVGLRNLVAAYDALISEGQSPPKVGMFLDTGAVARLEPQYRDLTKPQNQEIFYSLIRGYYDVVPDRVWARIDGRPIIWLWAAYFGIQFDRTLFDYITSRFEADYGIRPYLVGEDIWRYAHPSGGGVDYDAGVMPLDDFYIWGAAYTGFQEPTGEVAQIGPGYDERTLPGPDRIGRHRDREEGAFYARSFQQAIDSGSRIIAIETWNEFHEASDIANSEEYGRQYIELTRRFVDQFKGVSGNTLTGTAPSPTAISTPSATAPSSEGASPTRCSDDSPGARTRHPSRVGHPNPCARKETDER
jgi:hypothetical protein